jgi:hypothetical protein
MTELLIMIALLAALALGSASGGGPTTTDNASKGINPVQHSE